MEIVSDEESKDLDIDLDSLRLNSSQDNDDWGT
jgi:hypothetical protein